MKPIDQGTIVDAMTLIRQGDSVEMIAERIGVAPAELAQLLPATLTQTVHASDDDFSLWAADALDDIL
jgi:hypothetical protein